jgi:16S rRNA (cytosine1402-N4)-methyltransferase
MSASENSVHLSVLPNEVVQLLKAAEGGDFIDCTLGGGGHTQLILDANINNTVFACDRDSRAIERCKKKFSKYGSRITIVKARFSEVAEVAAGRKFDGLLADLGISTDQLFEERGFSFKDEGDLDMRMDQDSELSADEVVNKYAEKDLVGVFKRGGVASQAKYYARAIVKARPIQSTSALAQILAQVALRSGTKKKVHPATVAMQAIRIEVNQELNEIHSLLENIPSLLKDKGRAALISFHSGEDKLVAQAFRKWAETDSVPAWWVGERKAKVVAIGSMLSNEAITPTPEEVLSNAASRSARLRVFILGGN